MDWITEIIKKHVGEDGKLNVEEVEKEIKKASPENVVPKDQYNNVASQLKEANKTVKNLEKSVKDNPDVTKELESYKDKANELEKENVQLKIKTQAEGALRDAGVKDVDYGLFKLGNLELDKDGNVKDLENKLKDFQKNYPDQIVSDDNKEDDGTKPSGGYKPIDNKLDQGNKTTTYSFDELGSLSAEEINDNWDAVQIALEQGGNE